MTNSSFSIGSRLEVTPISPAQGKRWVAESASLPEGWTCTLIHRASMTILSGQPLSGWILNADSSHGHVEVSDSNFGFLPISDRMRPRYVAALCHLAELLKERRDVDEAAADAISEVKGMFSRCARQDQWDWRAVHAALGEPTRGEARRLSSVLGLVSAAIRRGDVKAARSGLQDVPARSDLVRRLLAARDAVKDSTPALPGARAPRVRDVKSSRPASRPHAVISTYPKEKLDSANATHAMLLDVLGQFLGAHGHRVEANQFVDAFTRLKTGPAIFEAKSITSDNEAAQIRHGLSQLYEYRYRHELYGATLWLVLSRIPTEEWVVNYLEKDRGVHVIWLEENQLSGPCVDRLLESGTEALRREKPTVRTLC